MQNSHSDDGLLFWFLYGAVITGFAATLQYLYLYVRFRPTNPMNLPWYLVLVLVFILSGHYMAIMARLRLGLAQRSKTGAPPRLASMVVYALAAVVAASWIIYALAEVVYFRNPVGLSAVIFVALPATVAYFWTRQPQSLMQSI